MICSLWIKTVLTSSTSPRIGYTDSMDLKKIVVEILEKEHLISLATIDDGGVWVSDVIYVFDDDLNIYWMSDPEVRHSEAILKNPQVAGTITISNKNKEPNLGIQISGIAERIEGKRFDLAIKHLLKRGYPEPKETDDVLQGDSWYVLKPKFIDVINEKLWGYDKQKLEF